MNKELIGFLRSEGMERIIEGMRKKYYSFGQLKGSIKLENPTEIEREALRKLALKSAGTSLNINIKKVTLALGMEEDQLEKVLRDDLGIDLITKEEMEEQKEKEKSEKISILLKGIKTKKLREYLLKNTALIKLEQASSLLKIMDGVVEGRENVITLGNLGGREVYDPHFLDLGTPNYRHLINYLKFYYNKEVSGVLEEKNLLLKIGIVGNSLSNFITIFGFDGKNKDARNNKLMDTDEDLNINVGNLYKIEKIISRNEKVLIVENSNVFIAIKEEVEEKNLNISLLCTSGQINQSGYMFLDKLVKEDLDIYYSGDIDPEGILIGEKLKTRYPSIKLIAYTRENLIKYLSRVKLGKESIKKLEKVRVTREISIELIDTLVNRGRGAYQEAFYREIIESIKEDGR